MQGTILPVGDDETAGGILAGMTQTVQRAFPFGCEQSGGVYAAL